MYFGKLTSKADWKPASSPATWTLCLLFEEAALWTQWGQMLKLALTSQQLQNKVH